MVADVQDEEISQAGQLKKYFDLVDDTGAWLSCCACGRNATSKALQNGNEVVLYFAHGRPVLGGSQAMVYILKDGAIVQCGKKVNQTVKRMQIVLGSA